MVAVGTSLSTRPPRTYEEREVRTFSPRQQEVLLEGHPAVRLPDDDEEGIFIEECLFVDRYGQIISLLRMP